VRFFLCQKVLFRYKKKHNFWTRQASFVPFFSPESWKSALSCYDNCTLLKNITNVKWPISYLSKNHFLSKKGPKQVLWIIFMSFKAIFSKTAVKMASKSIKNLVQKIFVYRPHRKILLFRIFFAGFATFKGRPPEPLRVFKLLTGGNSSQYSNEQSPKNRTGISSNLNFLQIYQYRRNICAISALMG
jgi:hypothetical protein